ncbi:hypothetical protein FHR83_002780 [Actinoplanes campanulatus]|uniref:EspG family protein n=1 Tax=Actinoplanes campanulatus TaxID=113559 RepID=A0A7W5AF07_9ACTN|nr:hypothetical protein [Actinoplanes campanulatus]MBB3095117.1 hypothetical protein [Actinoplanes campanulatus]GGN23616.1 hypothetical protein GCM10010109_38620 [Actinoplanes campanulatus]GID34721.1 hypothetical protein Aca09nite_12270 [Actinoplanes campanulatus]
MTAARRLVLDGDELLGYARGLGLTLPPGIVAGDPLAGVPPAGEALAVNLGVLARPVAAVRVEAGMDGRALRGWYALAGVFGASLFALPGDRAELSLFPAAEIGRELLRAVPDEPASVLSVLNPASVLTGTVSLDELREPDPAWFTWLPRDTTGPVARARAVTHGTLSALVTGRAPNSGVLAGRVVWLRTGDRWTGMRPLPGRRVRFEPVEPADFPSWLAPALATVLEASHG